MPGGRTDAFETAPTEDAEESAEENVATTDEGTKGSALFGSLSPQEAGRRSWETRRQRALAHETDQAHGRSDEVLVVRTTVETGLVLAKLSSAAKGGNVQAARELRGWLADLPIETDTDLSALDRRTRQAVLARVLSELEAEERAHDIETGPQGDAHAHLQEEGRGSGRRGGVPPPQ